MQTHGLKAVAILSRTDRCKLAIKEAFNFPNIKKTVLKEALQIFV